MPRTRSGGLSSCIGSTWDECERRRWEDVEEKYSACVLLLTPFWLVVTLDDIGAALFPALMDNTLVVHVYEETQELLHVVFDKLCVCGVGGGGGGGGGAVISSGEGKNLRILNMDMTV